MDILQVNSAIMFGDFTDVELNSIVDAVKFRRKVLVDRSKRSITLGSQVQFTSSKHGRTLQGTVEKIAIKFVTVRCAGQLWRVPANMLNVAA